MAERILIVGFFTRWLTHLGTELEIAQRHLDAGDDVELLSCDGVVESCRDNPYGDPEHCKQCCYRRNRAIQHLSARVHEHRLGNFLTAEDFLAVESSREVTEASIAKHWTFQDKKIGWGALSSGIDILRDPEGVNEQFQKLLPRLARSGSLSLLAVRRFLNGHGPFKKIYIFNGRFECTLGAKLAVDEIGMRASLHERGANTGRYAVFEDAPLHSRSAQHARVCTAWQSSACVTDAERIAVSFFEDRRAGSNKEWWNFTYRQKADLLPNGWDRSKKNIAIFNSSEDEWAAIGDEWNNDVYERQSIGIERIVRELAHLAPDVHLYLRMHPNLAGVDNADTQRLRAISSPNFTFIDPEAEISTYALLDSADKVLTFGSTVGIEAAFWGKVSILAGPALYESLGSVYVAGNHEEVLRLLCEDLQPLDRLGALQYGFYWQTLGTEFQYWKASSFIDGTFKGKSLHPLGTKFASLINRVSAGLSAQSPVTIGLCKLIDLFSRIKMSFQRKRK